MGPILVALKQTGELVSCVTLCCNC